MPPMHRRMLVVGGIIAIAIAAACSSFEDAPAVETPAEAGADDSSTSVVDGSDLVDGSDPGDASASNVYRAAVLKDEPLAYWRMGRVQSTNIVPDETGGANSLFLSGPDFVVDQPGIFDDDRAVWFGGASEGKPLNAAPFLFEGKAPFTLECWARREREDGGALGDQYQHLVSFVEGSSTGPDGSTENGYILYIQTSPTGTHAEHGSLEGGASNASGSFVADGKWAHYAMVMNGTQIILYIDGAEQNRTTVKGPLGTRTQKLAIANSSADTRYFRGYLDEVALYSKALSQEQLLAHYQSARP